MAMSRLTFTLILFAASLSAEDPVQKFRTFYPPDAPEAPAALKSAPHLSATATDGAVWTAAAGAGVLRTDLKAAPEDRTQYFAGKRYLPDDEIVSLAPDSARGVWVRTRTGISHIELRPMTLAQKADFFEQRVQARHDRFGMVASSGLRTPGDPSTNQLQSSDNDGLWTAMYAAAECYRYAVTKSPEALDRAHKAIDAVLFLEQVTGRPGFPARSYVKKSEQRPKDGQWHWTPDREIQWKGDTSSDEIVGHFFIFGVAYDVLDDAALKARIAATTRRIMDHILNNGYYLIDITGQPTLWGRWSPEYFASKRGTPDSPLNALELLSFLKTAHHITADARYDAEYRKVAIEMKYADRATRQLELCPEINYSDEELAMLPFFLAFRYERDPVMLDYYRRALAAWWKNIQREKNPLWTYIYHTAQPESPADMAGALWTLRRIPIDLIEWTVTNSNRKDIQWDPKIDRFSKRQTITLLPADERPVMKWNGNPFIVDGGNGGRGEDDGAFFLLPYWMGRYFGFVSETL
jgi:hypothetical protein